MPDITSIYIRYRRLEDGNDTATERPTWKNIRVVLLLIQILHDDDSVLHKYTVIDTSLDDQ